MFAHTTDKNPHAFRTARAAHTRHSLVRVSAVEAGPGPWWCGWVSGSSWDAEIARVDAVHELDLLDTPPEDRFDRITRSAADLLGTPVSFLGLMDLDRQFLKSRKGMPFDGAPRGQSLCTHTLRHGSLLEIPDTAADPAYADNPAVTGPPHLRFYAGQPLRDPDGHLLGTLCVGDQRPRALTDAQRTRLADLARWAELELTAVRTERAAERARAAGAGFVSVIGHELHAALVAIRGSLEPVVSGDPRIDRLVWNAVTNTDGLIRLADDVLVYSRLRDGTLRLRFAETPLPDVVGHAVSAVTGVAEAAGVVVVADPPSVSLRCDRDRLARAFTNLLANAVRVAPAGSEVLVGGCRDHHLVHVDVCDNGPGVPRRRLDRIFEPFVQLGVGGAGLGLAITKGIVAAHRGCVRARSRPGSGSTFTVTLPVQGPDADHPWW